MEQVELLINEIYSLEIISCPTLGKELISFFFYLLILSLKQKWFHYYLETKLQTLVILIIQRNSIGLPYIIYMFDKENLNLRLCFA